MADTKSKPGNAAPAKNASASPAPETGDGKTDEGEAGEGQKLLSPAQLTGECGALPPPFPDPRDDMDHAAHESVCGICGYDHDKIGRFDAGEWSTLIRAFLSNFVDAYLDGNLEDLVKAAIPATPAQIEERERLTQEQAIEQGRKTAARKAKSAERARKKAEDAAAEEQAKRDAAAEKAFEEAVPFRGDVGDITPKIVRRIAIDNGRSYSADIRIDVRHSELEPTSDGGLLLTKAVELPSRVREFSVVGVSLLTDAGALRTVLNGRRKTGGGQSISFPARTLVFRPAPPQADAE